MSAPSGSPTRQGALVALIRELIETGELAPGARITEQALAARFGVSRTPLREALRALATEGYVTLAPNRGARIAPLSPADIDELFPVMAQLEALAGELAAPRMTELELAELRALHYQMVLHYRRGEAADYAALNEAIHDRILAAAGNATLSGLYRSLAGRVRRTRYLARMSDSQWASAVAEHESILAALEIRDGARLAAVLKDHVATKAATVKARLKEAERADGDT